MSHGKAGVQVHVEAFAVEGPTAWLSRLGFGRLTHWSWFFLSLVVVTACNEAEFTGQTPQRADDPPLEAQAFALDSACDETADAPKATEVEVPGTFPGQEAPAHTAVYTGSLCPETPKALTVLFITDLSGSMSRHRADDGQMREGNDPLVSGSCGRLAAAEALVAKLEGGDAAAETRVGMIAFAGDVLSWRTIAPVSLADFRAAALNADAFCAHVAQDRSGIDDPSNPGGIDGRGVNASTNYAAAFRAASSLLGQSLGSGAAGAKVAAYFVSDGLPTAGGRDPAAAGIAAGKALRESVPSLALNGLLLGSTGAEAKSLLSEVVGDPARVRIAAEAADLAKEILAFPDPSLSGLTVRLTTAAKDGDEPTSQELAIDSFEADASGRWTFRTQAFALPTADFQITGEAKEAAGLTETTAVRVTVKTKARPPVAPAE
jgi:hypothetical protein